MKKNVREKISFFFRQLEDTIGVLQNDNEQLEQEKSLLKERLKQISKVNPMDLFWQKKLSGTAAQRTSSSGDGNTSPQRKISSSNSNEGLFTMISNENEVKKQRRSKCEEKKSFLFFSQRSFHYATQFVC